MRLITLLLVALVLATTSLLFACYHADIVEVHV